MLPIIAEGQRQQLWMGRSGRFGRLATSSADSKLAINAAMRL